jgi:hypothetical protein
VLSESEAHHKAVISAKASPILAVIPAKAGIQALNDQKPPKGGF